MYRTVVCHVCVQLYTHTSVHTAAVHDRRHGRHGLMLHHGPAMKQHSNMTHHASAPRGGDSYYEVEQ
jgi:hypothetical protein